MKKNYYLLTIIFFTFISVFTMLVFDNYVINSKHYEENILMEQKVDKSNQSHISSLVIPNDNQDKVVKEGHEESFDDSNYLKKNNLSQEKPSNDYINNDKKDDGNSDVNSTNADMKVNDKSKDMYNDKYLLRKANSLENYCYDNKETEQSVFKVSTWKIQENLTTSDKIKLLYISMKLGKEVYKKVETYLYSKDAEDGVLKALKLLKEDLSKKEYEKVRKIAGRFIDMDAAEKLY